MPNWVTNKIQAASHVISAMLNADGNVDFSTAAPFPGPCGADWSGISLDAEEAAEIVCGVPVDEHPLLAAMQNANRIRFDIKKLSGSSFEQFVGMVRNWRACGYLHPMDFARKVWGTKWNACDSSVELDVFQVNGLSFGACKFDTAWSCPKGVLEKISERFPHEVITVTYADEDIGSNCGTYTLKAGQVIESDIAPSWSDMDAAQKEKWKAFAYDVKGWKPDQDEDE